MWPIFNMWLFALLANTGFFFLCICLLYSSNSQFDSKALFFVFMCSLLIWSLFAGLLFFNLALQYYAGAKIIALKLTNEETNEVSSKLEKFKHNFQIAEVSIVLCIWVIAYVNYEKHCKSFDMAVSIVNSYCSLNDSICGLLLVHAI